MQPEIKTACRIRAPQHTVHRVHTDFYLPVLLAARAAGPLLVQAAAGESGTSSGRGFPGGWSGG